MKSDFGQLCDMLYVYNDLMAAHTHAYTIYDHERKLQHNVKIRFQFNDHHHLPFFPFAAAYTLHHTYTYYYYVHAIKHRVLTLASAQFFKNNETNLTTSSSGNGRTNAFVLCAMHLDACVSKRVCVSLPFFFLLSLCHGMWIIVHTWISCSVCDVWCVFFSYQTMIISSVLDT